MSKILDPGTILWSRYRILDLVGQGGMGAIYQAEDLRLEGRLCAIKEVVQDASLPQEFQEQFQEAFHREANILARLDHANLPKVSDFFCFNDRDYLVMDFVPGQDLREIITQSRHKQTFIPTDQVLTWVQQLMNALQYLHQQDPPVLHRDIKPSNIKLTPSGTIKLVDFGLVKLLIPDDSRTVTVLQGRATIQYAPLEQIGGDTGHTDARSDIYSVGATLFHLLTNEPPPDAKSRYLRAKILPPLSIRAINPAVPAQVEQAILHAMGLHPEERPKDIAQFRRELLNEAPVIINGHPANGWRFAIWRNRLLVGLVIVLLLMAIILTFLPTTPTPMTIDAGNPVSEMSR